MLTALTDDETVARRRSRRPPDGYLTKDRAIDEVVSAVRPPTPARRSAPLVSSSLFLQQYLFLPRKIRFSFMVVL